MYQLQGKAYDKFMTRVVKRTCIHVAAVQVKGLYMLHVLTRVYMYVHVHVHSSTDWPGFPCTTVLFMYLGIGDGVESFLLEFLNGLLVVSQV